MVKKLLATTALAAALAVSGCTGTQSQSTQALITEIQQGAIMACGFAPTIESVLSLIGVFTPGAGLASSIVSALCGALPPKAIGPGSTSGAGIRAVVVVKGVTVSGIYTR